jgi:hypothetical protein
LFEKQVGALAYCRVIGRSGGGSLTERQRSDAEREEKEQALLDRFLMESGLPVLIQFNLLRAKGDASWQARKMPGENWERRISTGDCANIGTAQRFVVNWWIEYEAEETWPKRGGNF